jgi:hypothetical protein
VTDIPDDAARALDPAQTAEIDMFVDSALERYEFPAWPSR